VVVEEESRVSTTCGNVTCGNATCGNATCGNASWTSSELRGCSDRLIMALKAGKMGVMILRIRFC